MMRLRPLRQLCARANRKAPQSISRGRLVQTRYLSSEAQRGNFLQRQRAPKVSISRIEQHNLSKNAGMPSFIRAFSSLPSYTPVIMPALSPTMEKGTIAAWKKQPGDQITPGDLLAEVETDKATVDFECQDEGYLAKILVPEGTSDVPLGKVVAIIVEDENDVAAFKDVSEGDLEKEVEGGGAEPAPAEAPKKPEPQSAPQSQQTTSPPRNETASPGSAASGGSAAADGRRVFASPLARKIARESNISIQQLAGRGTGPRGRILRSDVEEFLASGETQAVQAVTPDGEATPLRAATAGERPFVDVGITGLQRELAQKLTSSKRNIPHFYLTSEISLDKLLELRDRLNSKLGDGQQLSINDFVLRASALAMNQVPEVNASWLDEGYIRFFEYVDINLSIATEDGTVAPVIQDTQSLGLSSLNKEILKLRERVEEDSLESENVGTGTFSVVNVGAYGIRSLNPIITPPQACALGVGAITERIVPNDDGGDNSERPYKKVTGVNVTLSCDHRVVDGAVGAQWLQVFRHYLEDPETMLL